MDVKSYQRFCGQKIKEGYDVAAFGLGLGGETGEVLDIIKKAQRDGVPVDKAHLAEELGDVLWYVANIGSAYDLDLEKIIDGNVAKLRKRYNIREVDDAR